MLFSNVYAYSNLTVYDSIGERILYEYNGDEEKLIASTTKIMTGIVSLELSSLDNEFIIDEKDIDTYGSSIYLKKGDKIDTKSLLYGLLLRSGNDAALSLSNHITSNSTFIDLMNQKASSLKMKNTHFSNPHGLDDENQNYSTTNDMVKLISYAITNKDYLTISSARKYSFNNEVWYNKNELLSSYKYCLSGKTGYTPKAGYTFVSSAKKDGMIISIASFNDKDRFNTHKNLYKKYFDEYKLYEILNRYTFNIKDDKYKDKYLYIKEDYSMMLKREEVDDLLIDVYLYENNINNEYGFVSVKLKDEEVKRVYIYGYSYNERKKSVLDLIKGLFK